MNWRVLHRQVCWMLKSNIWTASFCFTDIHPIPLRVCLYVVCERDTEDSDLPWARTGLELLVWRNVFWLLTCVSVQGQCISVCVRSCTYTPFLKLIVNVACLTSDLYLTFLRFNLSISLYTSIPHSWSPVIFPLASTFLPSCHTWGSSLLTVNL